MADFGIVDVGDRETLEVATFDSSDNALSSVAAEVLVSAPSGEETIYTESDMEDDGSSLLLDILFDEAGYWYLEIEAAAGGGQETDAGWVRAVERPPNDLRFFTRDVWPRHLSEESMQADPDRIIRIAAEAERTVTDRYRETRPDGRFTIEGIDGEPLEEDVQLDGWIEDDGTIDLQETDDALINALRATVGAIVDWHLGRPDEAEHVSRKVQGDRTVEFREEDLPSSVFSSLRRFDERDVWH